MTPTSWLFEDSLTAVEAIRELHGEGLDPRSIQLHRWDARFCVRIGTPLSPRLRLRLEEKGGTAAPGETGVVRPEPTRPVRRSPRGRGSWARA